MEQEQQVEKRDDLVPGCRLIKDGLTYTLTKIESASNYGIEGSPCWYIEGHWECLGKTDYRYWKQDQDGGMIFPPLQQAHLCPVCKSNNIDQVGYFDSDQNKGWQEMRCSDCKSAWQIQWAFAGFDDVRKHWYRSPANGAPPNKRIE